MCLENENCVDSVENEDNKGLNELMGEDTYNELFNRALICEVAYFIGKNKKIDDYVNEKIISVVTGVDECVLFYIFCEFIVKSSDNATLQELYEMIDNDYVNAVDMFMKTYTDEEDIED